MTKVQLDWLQLCKVCSLGQILGPVVVAVAVDGFLQTRCGFSIC
ncbi:hypothetical protein Hanom_Chr05g00449421 [Helianthus anomalus]